MTREKRNLLQSPPRLPLVLPSILSADFAALGDDVASVMDAGADGIHIDVMDGHFAPNLTMGPAVVASLRQRFAEVYFDVHLMVNDPAMFVGPFAEAGADHLSFHIERFTGRPDSALEVVEMIRRVGCDAGLVVNPDTPAEAIAEVVEQVDLVLVMSVWPGFSGQAFIADVLGKVRTIRGMLHADQRLEMDGGINAATVGAAREAGCDTIVAASAVFGATDRGEMIAMLRGGGP